MIRIFINIVIILPDPNPCHWCIINHGITPTRGPVDERHLSLFIFSEFRVPDSLRNRPLDYHMYIHYTTTLRDGKLGDKNSYVWLGFECPAYGLTSPKSRTKESELLVYDYDRCRRLDNHSNFWLPTRPYRKFIALKVLFVIASAYPWRISPNMAVAPVCLCDKYSVQGLTFWDTRPCRPLAYGLLIEALIMQMTYPHQLAAAHPRTHQQPALLT